MTKKLIILLLSVVAFVAAAFCFSACNEELPTLDDGTQNVGTDGGGASDDGDTSDGGGSEDDGSTDTGGNTPSGGEDDGGKPVTPDDGDDTGNEGEQEHVCVPVHFDYVAADCVNSGNIEYWYCEDCGCYYADADCTVIIEEDDTIILPLEHTYAQTIVPPTCESEGYTDYVCTVCGDEYKGDFVPVAPHEYIAHIVPSDCEERGYTEYICKNCGFSYIDEQSYTEPVGHDFGEWEVITPATCVSEGESVRVCKSCGHREIVSTPKREHDYVKSVIEATCTSRGYTRFKCRDCGYLFIDESSYTPLAAHTFGEWEIITSPSCETDGEQVRKCLVCGATENQIIPALGHTYEANTVAPTCEEEGYTEYTCTVCHDSYIENIVPAAGHSFVEVVVAATCTAEGYVEKVCTVCGERYKVEGSETPLAPHDMVFCAYTKQPTCAAEGEALYRCSVCGAEERVVCEKTPHSYKSTVVQPTCEEGGYTLHECSVCGDSYKDCMTSPLGHSCEAVVIEPTCYSEGYTIYKCVRCSFSYTDEQSYTPMLPHTFGEWTSDVLPDCTEKGSDSRTCIICGAVESRDVPALGHSYGEWTAEKEATCAEAGLEVCRCTVCGNEVHRTTAPLGHDYEETIVPADCTHGGYTLHRCANCGVEFSSDFTDPVPHTYGDWTVTSPSTCEKQGEECRECIVCGLKDSRPLPLLSHEFGEWSVLVEADCENGGVDVRRCALCGRTEERTTQPLGHTEGVWAVIQSPTCTESGMGAFVCGRCNKVLSSEVIAPSGHNFVACTVYPTCTQEGYTQYVCANGCGESYFEDVVPPLGHSYGEWTIVTSPSCEIEGVEERVCEVCGDCEERAVPATGHTYTASVVPATCTEQGYTLMFCTHCGESYRTNLTDALGHSYIKTEFAPTADSAGLIVYSCTRCGHSYEEALAALPATEGLIYKLTGGYYVVVGLSEGATAGSIVIPSTHNGVAVKEIDAGAFAGNTSITSVLLGDGIERIGDTAFKNCSMLATVNIPSAATYIGSEAFRGCISLKRIDYNAVEVTSAETNIFSGAGISDSGITMYVGAGVKVIPANLFYSYLSGAANAVKLTGIVFAENGSLEKVLDSAFYGCTYLHTVILPDTVSLIDYAVFCGCTSIEYIAVPKAAKSYANSFEGVPADAIVYI